MDHNTIEKQKKEFRKRVREYEFKEPIDWGMVPLNDSDVMDDITDEVYDYITSIPKNQREITLSIFMAKHMAEITSLKIQQALFLKDHPKFYGGIDSADIGDLLL